MPTLFKTDFFVGNRARLYSKIKHWPVVVGANYQLQRNADNTYPFRQDSNFWYLTGLDLPAATLVIDKTAEYLILPKRSSGQDRMEGRLDEISLSKRSGLSQVMTYAEGWAMLSSRLKKVKNCSILLPSPVYVENMGFATNPARRFLAERIKAINSHIQFADIRSNLTGLRAVKQLPELKAITAAIDVTVNTLQELAPTLAVYTNESQIEADLTHGFFRRGAHRHAFAPIVASGRRACTPHYASNNHALKNEHLVLLDVGAEIENYAADITRTYALTVPNKRQRDVYAAVLSVQTEAVSLLRPGVVLRDYEQIVEQIMGEHLAILGLIKNISSSQVRRFYPHSTSHFLGLDVHDVGEYDKPLQSGMVLTVEPGIYIAKEQIGVRLEDDYLVTDTGLRNLTNILPKHLRTVY